jgi:hypothetical protein
MTVADGAGSALLAEIGSTLASRHAQEYVRNQWTAATLPVDEKGWQSLLRDAIASARKILIEEAARRGVPLQSLATTLIIALTMPESVVVAQIGDGMTIVADAFGEIAALTLPDRGEYSNETTFLTSRSALESISFIVWKGKATGTAVMTDGLLPVTTILPLYQPFAPFFKSLFAFLRTSTDDNEAQAMLYRYLLSDKVQEGTADDLTLVVAVRK